MLQRATQAAEKLHRHPFFALIVTIVTMAGAVAGVIAVWPDRSGDVGTSPTTASASNSAVPSGGPIPLPASTARVGDSTVPSDRSIPLPASPSSVAIIPGTCLDAAIEIVGCDMDHQYEVYSYQNAGTCDTDALLRYLGGIPTIDLLRPEISAKALSIRGQSICALTASNGGSLPLKTAGILQTRNGDALRECWDSRVESEVACSEPHTAEVVSIGTGAHTTLDCQAKVERYIGAPMSGLKFDLHVDLTVGANPQCRIEVLAHNVLTASVRGLGTSTPPISALP